MNIRFHAIALAAALGMLAATDARADWAYDYNTTQTIPGILPSTIDPGSYQYVNRYYTDPYGSTWHEVGPVWTSGGVPQSQLTRQLVSQGYYAYPHHVVSPLYGPRFGIGVGPGIGPGIGVGVGYPGVHTWHGYGPHWP
jgi:hypothetical protein